MAVTKILTTHVGSLPRERSMVDMIFAREKGGEVAPAVFDAAAKAHVADVVARQIDAGIDLVSDGETTKISYATYIAERFTGFAGDSPRNAPADLKMFPDYLEKLAQSGGTPTYARPQCVAEITVKTDAPLHRDIANLRAAVEVHGGAPFMNAVSPGTVALFQPNAFYPDDDAYLDALAEAMRSEYEAIAAAGFLLQIDCPDLALARHMVFTDKSDDEFIAIAMRRMEKLNHALGNVAAEQCRLHVCWGNYEGPHVCDIDMDKVFPVLMSAKAKYILFESSNPRHAHEWRVFARRAGEVPADKVLIPGVIDSTTNFVEHPQLVAERIERFAGIFGAERIIAGSDCGFGTFAGYGAVAADIVWAKLRALAEGAQLACRAGGG